VSGRPLERRNCKDFQQSPRSKAHAQPRELSEQDTAVEHQILNSLEDNNHPCDESLARLSRELPFPPDHGQQVWAEGLLLNWADHCGCGDYDLVGCRIASIKPAQKKRMQSPNKSLAMSLKHIAKMVENKSTATGSFYECIKPQILR